MEDMGRIAKEAIWAQAAVIVESLENSSYSENFQPSYADQDYLIEAVHELLTTAPATQPRYVDHFKNSLAAVSLGKDSRPIVITGSCSERVLLSADVHGPARTSMRGLQIVEESAMSHAIHIRRERGQNTKPRSEETEEVKNSVGKVIDRISSYMGDSINAPDQLHRDPDPGRLVAAAVQARDIEEELQEKLEVHIPAAHEALNLYYEKAFIRQDPRTPAVRKYLLSADLPWIGLRTNQPDSDHVKLLSNIINPVGVKLDHRTTTEHLVGLVERLNPAREAGKLVLMPRFGLAQIDKLPDFLCDVKKHAPESILLYDVHGSTKTRLVVENGLEKKVKIRYTGDIIDEVEQLAIACKVAGLMLHGLHLETTTDDTRLECIDNPDDLPQNEGGIDPQLNPRQTKHVLSAVANILEDVRGTA